MVKVISTVFFCVYEVFMVIEVQEVIIAQTRDFCIYTSNIKKVLMCSV